jgi:hypothetical protein
VGYEFKIGKNIIIIILFLFLFGIVIQLSRSNYLLQLNTGNKHLNNIVAKPTSALSAKEVSQLKQDKFLVIFDPSDLDSVSLKDNTVKTLDYMKKTYGVIPVAEIPKDLSSYKNVIISFSALDKVSDINILTDYAYKGGKVLFETRPEIDVLFSIYRKMGIYEFASDFKDTTGIKMNSDLLLNAGQLKIKEKFIGNSSLSVHLNETSKVYAYSAKGVPLPLLWSTPYGKGTMMIFNGTMLSSKVNRGLIAGSLSYLNTDFIYPIMNSKVVYIDDFPAPFREGIDLYKDYKRDNATFFRDVWWPDVERAAKASDVKYTGVLIETYNDQTNQTKKPFKDRIGEENLKIFGRDLIKSGGEIGVHGYNHQSLTEDQKQVHELGYKAWNSEKDMAESLKEAKAYFNANFPNYILHTYVPPSNVLSEEGKKAIHEAIPSINVIASVYEEDADNIAYAQELEANKTFTELPRFTSGYQYSDENKWTIANTATLFGTFSHFIHPDDILDKVRSGGKSWNVLSKQYSQMLLDVKTKYPWMKSMTASESADALKVYSNSKVFISQKSNSIEVSINHFTGELDFLLRSDKPIKNTKNCDIEKVSSDHYLVHAKADKLEIQLGGKE